MSTQEQTYLPTDLDADLIAVLDSVPADHGTQRYYLDLPGRPRVELPAALASMLRQVVQAMREGLAVTVKPQTQQLTTTQVADLLGVTR
ncbi:MAG: DNA-binding protein, partial [Micrococcales bacterium]|nr:DNA-binding protein [Micrococcales bacterium]